MSNTCKTCGYRLADPNDHTVSVASMKRQSLKTKFKNLLCVHKIFSDSAPIPDIKKMLICFYSFQWEYRSILKKKSILGTATVATIELH